MSGSGLEKLEEMQQGIVGQKYANEVYKTVIRPAILCGAETKTIKSYCL